MSILRSILCLFLVALLLSSNAWGRISLELEAIKNLNTGVSAQDEPCHCTVSHRVGKLVLAVANKGVLAGVTAWSDALDCITGELNRDAEYPKDSDILYAFACCFWIGAVVGRDTLVSTGADGWSSSANEFAPAICPFGQMIYRSIRFPERPEIFNGAVSEEDYIAVYSDTAAYQDQQSWDGLPHRPMNIEVTQRSYAWSYAYAEDFILFDYEIKNIGRTTLENVYMGFYNDSDVGFAGLQDRYSDDICGFRQTFTTSYEDLCYFEDTVNIAWIADNDGDPDGVFTDQSCPGVTGMRIVRTPADQLNVSFNWWISNGDASKDYGPRERDGVGVLQEEFRDFSTGGQGTPEGDYNKYYMLRNQEFDYDQIFAASISPTDPLWSYPPQEDIRTISDGFDTRYLLSFGPFDIEPGEKLPISFAYVAAENFHRDPNNLVNLPDYPSQYYDNLDFSDLALNSTWASRVYDNPAIDSDGDGWAGKVRICCTSGQDTSLNSIDDTLVVSWYDPLTCSIIPYEGDGVPDFQGASPPPPPAIILEPSIGSVRVRFNGTRTETTPDVFSRIVDFEGYRVYIGRDARESSYGLVASYDVEDYNKYVWNADKVPDAGYELREVPFTVDSLRVLYGETFNPQDYPQATPYTYLDSSFYFEPQDYNSSELGVTTPIRKVYQDEIEAGTLQYPSSLNPEEVDPEELTDEGLFKYFEYEVLVDSLLPTVEWWISVSSFDFGSPESGLQALESARSANAVATYALSSHDDVEELDKKVFVYPNPYRSDAGYRADGFEGRLETDRPNDRVRALHFANLPPKCTIRIYSLDGDLIREIDHDTNPSDPESTHEIWDMITRNTQMIVSGIYYWTVESEDGETQIGKFVVIM